METQNENGTALIERKPTTLKEAIEFNKTEYLSLIPTNHANFDRVFGSFFLELKKDTKLGKCEPKSLIEAFRHACYDGLVFGTNRCYLIPYGNVATYQRSYLGIIDLVRRSGAIKKIGAGVVYQNDEFDIVRGSEDRLIHVPSKSDAERGDMVGAYMYAHTAQGLVTEYMTISDLEAVRKKSKMANGGAWKEHYEEMCKKVVLRRGLKYLPLEADLLASLQEEDEREYQHDNSKKIVSSDLNQLIASSPSQDQESFESENLEPEEVDVLIKEAV